jgi:hypothetical protein
MIILAANPVAVQPAAAAPAAAAPAAAAAATPAVPADELELRHFGNSPEEQLKGMVPKDPAAAKQFWDSLLSSAKQLSQKQPQAQPGQPAGQAGQAGQPWSGQQAGQLPNFQVQFDPLS